MTTTFPRRRPRNPSVEGRATRRWIRPATWVLAGGLALAFGLVFCVTCRPADYRAAAVNYATLLADKKALVDLVDRIGADLNAGRACSFSFSEAQANRWLAARSELPFDLDRELPSVEGPCVRFLPDGIVRIAGLFQALGGGSVVTLDIRPTVDRESLRLTVERARLGALPVPPGILVYRVGQLMSHDGSTGPQVIGPTVVLQSHNIWMNGKRPFRVREVMISGRVLSGVLEPD